MTAQRAPALPEVIRNEVARLKGAGYALLPLGGGADGKTPLARSWATSRLTLPQVLGAAARGHWSMACDWMSCW